MSRTSGRPRSRPLERGRHVKPRGRCRRRVRRLCPAVRPQELRQAAAQAVALLCSKCKRTANCCKECQVPPVSRAAGVQVQGEREPPAGGKCDRDVAGRGLRPGSIMV